MTSVSLFLTNFHFIRPWWFLGLIALVFALWLLRKHRFNHSPWNKLLPTHLSQVLIEGADVKKTNNSFFTTQKTLIKPLIIGLLTITALAGPAWQKLPQPVYQAERGSVLIMDMSYSMYSTDIKPNRLTRARYKAVDLLNKINEGDLGLIAYAGDAFVISPLTQDIKNIELLLPSLSPEIMPELGANPFAALALAHEMLINAGHINGDIYWFTDDVDNEDMADIYDWSAKFGHQLNILGIGSQQGAPITLPSGELLKDSYGAIVVPKLPIQKLKALAQRGNGQYQTISHNENDIEKLFNPNKSLNENNTKEQKSQQNGDQWREQGPWLILIILPLLLSYFRRGSGFLTVSMSLPLLTFLTSSLLSPISFAYQEKSPLITPESNQQQSALSQTWQNLWKTDDQQAQHRYNQQDYQGAAQQFKNNQWQGSAHYKAGNYQEALDAFKQGENSNSANSLYNQGNALAQMQQFEKAIDHYEQALSKDPNLQDAKDNLEKIKQQQKEQEQKQEQQEQQSQDSQSKDEQQQSQNDKQQQQKSDEQQSQSQKDQQKQQSNDDKQQSDADSENKEPQKSEPEKLNEDQKEKQNTEEQQKSEQPNGDPKEQAKEKTAAQMMAEQQAKETEQKHQQLLNKVTDDPYLLLRNKMQLEYQKRRQNGASQGAKKKW